MNISPAQVGKIENIKHNAIDEVKEAVSSGKVSITVANNINTAVPAKIIALPISCVIKFFTAINIE